MAGASSEPNVPSDLTGWVARPDPFNAEESKRGKLSRLSDGNSTIEQLDPVNNFEDCVAYTDSPLPLVQVWQITIRSNDVPKSVEDYAKGLAEVV